jgi:hypothetical protein
MESNVRTIKELPRVEEILSDNLLIIEDQQGTKSLQFVNFIVGPRNVSFYNPMVTNIRSLCTFCASLCSTLERNTGQTLQAVNTRFSEATGALVVRFPDFEYQTGLIGILNDQQIGEAQFTSTVPDITPADMSFTAVTMDNRSPSELPQGQTSAAGVLPIAIGLRNEVSVVNGQVIYTYFLSATSSKPTPPEFAQVYAWKLFRPR